MSATGKRVLVGLGALAVVLVLIAAWLLGLLTPEPDEVSLAETVAVAAEESGDSAEAVDPDPAEQQAAASDVDAADEESDDPEPAEVAAPTPESAAPAASATGAAASEPGPFDGEWQLVPSAGTFAGYRANGATGEAVGRTTALAGTLVAQENSVTAVEITVDMTQLTSDSRVRDDHLGDEGITWRTHPEASFSLSEPIALPLDVAADEELAFAATGVLTVREIPQLVTVQLDATLVGEQLIAVGSTAISLDDFGAGIGGVDDAATMEFSLVFAR